MIYKKGVFKSGLKQPNLNKIKENLFKQLLKCLALLN